MPPVLLESGSEHGVERPCVSFQNRTNIVEIALGNDRSLVGRIGPEQQPLDRSIGLQSPEDLLGPEPSQGAGAELAGPGRQEGSRLGGDAHRLQILGFEVAGIRAETGQQFGFESSRVRAQIRKVKDGQLVAIDVLENG